MIKPNKLKIFKIFSVIIFIFSMTSCKPYLNEFAKYEIKKEYAEFRFPNYSAKDISIVYYVGKYNNYHILLLKCYDELFAQAIVTESYDDEKITYGNSNRLWAYKDEQFYRLPDLYKSGELSKENIISIRDTFYQLEEESVNDTDNNEESRPKIIKPYINLVTKNKIRREYVEQFYPDNTPKDFYIEYYVGKYNGYRVLMFSLTDKKYGNIPYLDKIGDVYISYSNSKRLTAYKNGEFYTLQELYKKEELTEKEINEIRITFNNLRYY